MSALMDRRLEAGLRILLQLALDEMGHVVEAVDHQHDTKPGYLKYGTPYEAINGVRKVRDDILIQAAMWGIDLVPKRNTDGLEPVEALARGLAREQWPNATDHWIDAHWQDYAGSTGSPDGR